MRAVKRLSKDLIIELHALMALKTGGGSGLRDAGLLESAACSVFQSFGGSELYPSLEEKAARLGFALVGNHAFVDGNKRIGLLSMMTFMKLNGKPIKTDNESLVQLGIALASGELSYEELLCFIRENS